MSNFAEENIRCFDQSDHDEIIGWLKARFNDPVKENGYYYQEAVIHIEYLLSELIEAKRELIGKA